MEPGPTKTQENRDVEVIPDDVAAAVPQRPSGVRRPIHLSRTASVCSAGS